MRGSNHRNVPGNKAAVSISSNLYDRRALDSSADQPLVNSLNHLTFLTSSSAKVRDTLAHDGGLERLVGILHECHSHSGDNLLLQPTKVEGLETSRSSIEKQKRNILTAWKWTLAFQCLVLVATRGTEDIRKRVVEAGVLPMIATVLDSYLLYSKNFDNETDSKLNVQFLEMVSVALEWRKSSTTDKKPILDSDDPNDYKDMNIQAQLTDGTKLQQLISNADSPEPLLEVSTRTVDDRSRNIDELINCPRAFLDGKLIPKEDDIVWSLQLLAFTSKYSSLKYFFQCTSFVEELSLRYTLFSAQENIEDECVMHEDTRGNRQDAFPQHRSFPIRPQDYQNSKPGRCPLRVSINKFCPMARTHSTILAPAPVSIPTPTPATKQWSLPIKSFCQPKNSQIFSQSFSGQLSREETLDDLATEPSTQRTDEPLLNRNLLLPVVSQSEAPILKLKKHTSDDDLAALKDNDDMLMGPQVHHTQSSSSATSTSSSVYGTSLADDDSLHVSTLPSSVYDLAQEVLTETYPIRQMAVESEPQGQSQLNLPILQNQKMNENIDGGLIDSMSKLNDALMARNKKNKLVSFVDLRWKLNKYNDKCLTSYQSHTIEKSKNDRKEKASKYNYKTYFLCDHHDGAPDSDVQGCKKRYQRRNMFHNLFPLVEKFTVPKENSSDMCYWAGVVMRNSCRKDEARGGIRQCAYHGCGKWEQFTREFAKCRRCKRTKYCSKECQMKAWSYHKHWCVESGSSASAAGSSSTATTTAQPTVPATATSASTNPVPSPVVPTETLDRRLDVIE